MEIRDGVAIDPGTGVAEDHKKYDFEVLPAGTTFPVRLDLLVSAETEHPDAAEKALLKSLASALEAFSHGESAFGARRSRELGCVSAVWTAKRFDLGSEAGWVEWLLSDHQRPLNDAVERACIRAALENAAPEFLKPISLHCDARKRVVIALQLEVVHDLLVRSPGVEPDAPDVSHLHSGGAAILPGTRLAGVMRAQALRIAKLVRDDKKDAETWINRLFGPRFEGQRSPHGFQPQASRLRISEARLNASSPQRQTRVAIDRFTQGVVNTALFEEQTEVGGRAEVRLELRNPHEGELGLVLLTLKDLLDGTLPVGGASSVGRGVLRGAATVTWHEGNGSEPDCARIEPGSPPTGDAAGKIDRAIRAFHDAACAVREGDRA